MKTQLRSTVHCLLAAVILLAAGCTTTRSISDSGYRKEDGGGYRANSHNANYQGELSEFDVLGIEAGANITDEQIVRTLDSATKTKLRKGSSVLVIQSGAYVPDSPVVSELNKYFNVVPFGGQPPKSGGQSYSKSLRLAAAQATCESIICYWGTLESAVQRHGTKAVSWVPIVGGIFPDETQQMRIRLKVAVVDTRTGSWSVFSPEAYEDKALSGKLSRELSDQTQVEKLKRLAYQTAITDLMKLYAN
ncbi:MAG: aminopeptidase [Verrucomicrobia bacterium]|nr:aminopeptidase [Verrucomicrobiota bacterium]